MVAPTWDGESPAGRSAGLSGMFPSSTTSGGTGSTPTCLSLMPAGLYDGRAVSTTKQSFEGNDAGVRLPGAVPPPCDPEAGATRVEVALGRRVMVVSDLLLTPVATPSTTAVSAELARALDTWDGPGLLIIAGNLFDLTDATSLAEDAHRSIEAHQSLHQAFTRFLDVEERRGILQISTHHPGYGTDAQA